MTDSWTAVRSDARTPSWSNRILIAAVVGIFFLTLYPFRFSLVRHGPPFLLAGWGKDASALDAFLNILLFVPYGFGLAELLRERGKSRAAVLAITFLAGALVSYSVELLQFYIPMRDSGWGDVVTNSIGSVLGYVVYELAGAAILRVASRMETAFVSWLNWRRLVVGLLLYVSVCLVASIHLQRDVRISDWTPDSMLVIAGSAAEEPSSWNGKALEVEFWDRALSVAAARALTSGSPEQRPAPLASYDFSGPPPFQDRRHFLPDLAWTPDASVSPALSTGLISRAPVATFVKRVERTNQFSLHLICRLGQAVSKKNRIVLIVQPPRSIDLELGQQGTHLTFWFRNPLSAKRPRVYWDVPNVLASNQLRNILVSYDGSRLCLYVDGKKEGQLYRMDPGAALALLLRWGNSSEMEGYHDIFYALVFFPAGCLLGLGWRKLASQTSLRLVVMLLEVLVVPVVFEICLALAGSTSVWLGNIALSALLILAGAFWANADNQRPGNRDSAAAA